MRDLPTREQWRRLDGALDRLIDVPAARRDAEIARLAGGDAAFARELRELAAHLDDEEFLRGTALPVDEATGSSPASAERPRTGAPEVVDGVRAGARIGDWRLVAPLGRGGMGEVWSAERADGQFEQSVAIKLLRPEARTHWARFEAERRILARLDHPGIARLLDGGVTEDGRPYMVMERVDGEPFTRWCARRASPLAERLDVWLQVAEAVQSAHQQLVVHRDLKPANVLVREDGRVKLLDFGIARLLDDTVGAPTLGAPMTPGYAAPEQWRGEAAGVATDVYALGLLGYELLAGAPPFGPADAPLAASLQRVLTETAPLASRTARARAAATAPLRAPVPARSLAGDLDAILARCLRTEAADRYGSVRELIDDLQRHRRHEPVRARAGARWYVASRALRRHRLPLAAGVLVLVVSTSAALGMAWQAREARRSAAQAIATKAFLLSLFRANDARVAQDRPLGSITARELLDQNADRIEREFAAQPELEIELLATVRDLYGYLGEDERFEHFQRRTMSLARAHYGDHHPIVIEGIVTDAWGDIDVQDYAAAERTLAQADRLLREARLDESALRAEWWLAHGESLRATPGGAAARLADNERAAALFRRVDPRNPSYAAALANIANAHYRLGDLEVARREGLNAIDVAATVRDRSDLDLAVVWRNQGRTLQALGDADGALAAFARASDLARRSAGERSGTYWSARAEQARLRCLRGEREAARATFDALRRVVPPGWTQTTDDVDVQVRDAECRLADGHAEEARPLLEHAVARYAQRAQTPEDADRARHALASTWLALGRPDAARAALRASASAAPSASASASASASTSAPAAVRDEDLEGRMLLAQAGLATGGGEAPAARLALRAIAGQAASAPDRLDVPWRARLALVEDAVARRDKAGATAELARARAQRDAIRAVVDLRLDERQAALVQAVAALP